MTKRTRLFLFASVGILVVGLGTGLVASYVGGFQNLVLIGSDGPDELAYVPQDAQMVAYADVHSIASSNVRKKVRELSGKDTPPENQFEQHTGINIERDVDHVVAASMRGADDKGDMPLILARGKFDTVRIEGAMREQGGTAGDYRGTRIVSMPERDQSKPQPDRQPQPQHVDMAVAFLEPGLLAFGPVDAVHRAVDMKISHAGSIKDNTEVMRLVKDVKDGDAWAVARFDALAGRTPLPRDLASRLPPITWFSASGNVDDGIRGMVKAETRDDQAAQDLREVIRGFMALARMQAGNKAEFSTLINSLQLSGDGKDVTLAFSVPPEMLDTLAAMRAQHGDLGHAPAAPRNRQPAPAPRPHRGA